MSTFAVKVEKIVAVEPHPNADRLDLVQVLDWHCVTTKGEFKPGDLCVYLPIDSVLPPALEAFLFPEDSKVTLHKSRIRTIKLRGAISQGMCLRNERIGEYFGVDSFPFGTDLTKLLYVTKYEPEDTPTIMRAGTPSKQHPHFKKYTDLENIKNYPGAFNPGELIVVTEKIHGTSARFSKVPFFARTWFQKIKKFLGLTPAFEFVYGSRNVQLYHERSKTWFPTNVYAKIAKDLDLPNLIPNGIAIYGEIYGSGIQKNYNYGCKLDERKFVVFDVMNDGKYLDTAAAQAVAKALDLEFVPTIYSGPFISTEHLKALTVGRSVLCQEQRVREGVVVKPVRETVDKRMGRKVLKVISDDYLLKDQSEHH